MEKDINTELRDSLPEHILSLLSEYEFAIMFYTNEAVESVEDAIDLIIWHIIGTHKYPIEKEVESYYNELSTDPEFQYSVEEVLKWKFAIVKI